MDDVVYITEYLARIKSVAVSIELPKHKVANELGFESVSKAVVKSSDGSNYRINLSEDVSAEVAAKSHPIAEDSNTVSFRLPGRPDLAREESSSVLSGQLLSGIPWPASMLTGVEGQFVCSNCRTKVIECKGISKWRQLPSETWAEMMDFWHCHKPADGSTEFNPSYAVSRFIPSQGMPFVGATYFTFDNSDVSLDLDRSSTVVACACGNQLGTREADANWVKLWKWQLAFESQSAADMIPTEYPYSAYVSVTLAELIDSHASYTFMLEPDTPENESGKRALIWVFNADIVFTSSSSPTPKRAFKVFYSACEDDIELLQKTRPDIEEVNFPPTVIDGIIDELKQSTKSLPCNYKGFAKWQVGFLPKV